MPIFTPGAEVTTTGPLVEVSPESGLRPGRHWFRLTVEDDAGNVSQPEFVAVLVFDRTAPTAIFEVVSPGPVVAGTTFSLDASASRDLGGGQIARYHWTVLPQEETP